MPKITDEVVRAAYGVAKKVYEKSISPSDGIKVLESEHGMNSKSAVDYIYNYQYMIEGRRFARTTNAFATRYYLEKILEDSGRNKLLSALSALRQHIDYYETVVNANVVTRRKIYDEFRQLASVSDDNVFPDEVDESGGTELLEGTVRTVSVNIYERNPVARTQCIEHYGCRCYVCGFDFSDTYGDIGRDFIHVHHEVELASIGAEYVIDPINDLKPVCPNCHAMLHRRKPAYSVSELKNHLTSTVNGRS